MQQCTVSIKNRYSKPHLAPSKDTTGDLRDLMDIMRALEPPMRVKLASERLAFTGGRIGRRVTHKLITTKDDGLSAKFPGLRALTTAERKITVRY